MTVRPAILDPTDVRRLFVDNGVSITEWATAHGFRREVVYGVLSGRLRGHRGEAHKIAVALRLKATRAAAGISGLGAVVPLGLAELDQDDDKGVRQMPVT